MGVGEVVLVGVGVVEALGVLVMVSVRVGIVGVRVGWVVKVAVIGSSVGVAVDASCAVSFKAAPGWPLPAINIPAISTPTTSRPRPPKICSHIRCEDLGSAGFPVCLA